LIDNGGLFTGANKNYISFLIFSGEDFYPAKKALKAEFRKMTAQ